MKKLTLKIIIMSIIVVLPIYMFCALTQKDLTRYAGYNEETRIRKAFENVVQKDYKIIILGNSRMYRGVDPDEFSQETFNFSHDNDTYNQIYYKLQYLKINDKLPAIVVLGTDYFQFSFISNTRNYIYKDLFQAEYMKDYRYDYAASMDEKMTRFQNSLRKRFESLKYKERENKSLLKDNGHMSVNSQAGKDVFFERDKKRLKIQEEYFEEILKFNRENNIKTILVMPPLRDIERRNYTREDIDNFEDFLQRNMKQGEGYLNYAFDDEFSLEDFCDKTHLNKYGASKFSAMLWNDIEKNKRKTPKNNE